MIRIQTRRCNPGAALLRNRSDIEDVVEVTVRDDDSADRFPVPTSLAKSMPQKSAPADEPRIQQVQSRTIAEDVEIQGSRPHLEHVWRKTCIHQLLADRGELLAGGMEGDRTRKPLRIHPTSCRAGSHESASTSHANTVFTRTTVRKRIVFGRTCLFNHSRPEFQLLKRGRNRGQLAMRFTQT